MRFGTAISGAPIARAAACEILAPQCSVLGKQYDRFAASRIPNARRRMDRVGCASAAIRSTTSSDTISPATFAKRFRRAVSVTKSVVHGDDVAGVIPTRGRRSDDGGSTVPGLSGFRYPSMTLSPRTWSTPPCFDSLYRFELVLDTRHQLANGSHAGSRKEYSLRSPVNIPSRHSPRTDVVQLLKQAWRHLR